MKNNKAFIIVGALNYMAAIAQFAIAFIYASFTNTLAITICSLIAGILFTISGTIWTRLYLCD
jgi:hypothetical protein